MKKSFCGGMIVLLLCMLMLGSVAYAGDTASVTIGVDITLAGTLPSVAETFFIQLSADDAAYPMPQGSINGRYVLEVQGAAQTKLPSIVYDGVGKYTYTLRQRSGTNAKCSYDPSVYTLTVYVTYEAKGKLMATAVLYKTGETEKQDDVVFHNVYATVKPTPTPPPKDGSATATGVVDRWQYYLAGAAVLLVISGVLVAVIRRTKEDDDGAEG